MSAGPHDLQRAKQVVLDYYEALDAVSVSVSVSASVDGASGDDVAEVLRKHTAEQYRWRGMHPFHEQSGADAVADVFWRPTKTAFASLQRRPDVFLAGVTGPGTAPFTDVISVMTQAGHHGPGRPHDQRPDKGKRDRE